MLDRVEYLRSLIGRPYKANAKGPEEFDCWSLVCEVRKNLFGDVLPDFEVPDKPGLLWLAKMFEKAKEREHWKQVVSPSGVVQAPDGAVVLMTKASHAIHCGVWLKPERSVIHAIEIDGVVFQDLMTLRGQSWTNLRFFERADA